MYKIHKEKNRYIISNGHTQAKINSKKGADQFIKILSEKNYAKKNYETIKTHHGKCS